MTPLLVLTLVSWFDDSIAGSGNKTTVARQLAAFTSIEMEGGIDADVREGDTLSVEVTIDDNLQGLIKTEVAGGVLKIYETKQLRWRGKGVVTIVLPTLLRAETNDSGDLRIVLAKAHELRVDTNGSGDISLSGPVSRLRLSTSGSGDAEIDITGEAESVTLDTNGSGDLEVHGKALRLEAESNGSGDIDAEHLTAAVAKLATSGSGDIVAHVSKEVLSAESNGSGDIDIYGSAKLRSRDRNGSGDVSCHSND